jgi:predicted DCC family thiol-disulfide oxidoreductase YuxK
MQPVTVYYDRNCPICRKEAEFYLRRDKWKRVIWQDIADAPPGLFEDSTSNRTAMLLHARDAKGQLRKGVNAYNALWSELPNYFLIAFFTKLYSFKWIAIIVYAIFWRARWHIGKHKKYH